MLDLVLAPDPIYKTICTPVDIVDDTVRATLNAMMHTLQHEQAMGIGAPMVGLTQRLVVVDLDGKQYKMVNPVITRASAETRTTKEASVSFPGIDADVTRPVSITVEYLDENGTKQTLDATGLLATCIQHEMDYLDGKTILDHQSPMKRDILKRKMEKEKRRAATHVHVHGPNCNHG